MEKTKTFITVIPFQGQDEQGNDMLKPVLYSPAGNTRLAYGETRFPIIPVINGYAKKDDKIRVIAILSDGANFMHNFETYFKPEVEALVKNNELKLDEIEVIQVSDKEDIDTQLKLFSDLIDKVENNEEIFACITYGTKPTPIVINMALNYAYRIKEDVNIGCIVYGRYLHTDSTGTLYDTTALFYLESVVNKVADMNVKDPEKAIRAMLDFKGGEGND
ncbi:MAG: hypothetical protein CVU99_10600 [Firmicutes bacterium HGW-Firmicutes-4]|jgi:hypothetical protein|nr:MAG: hypothetical protein CVU99_10600 [Firmicutes bacterium HGW-Firmicutes-4]